MKKMILSILLVSTQLVVIAQVGYETVLQQIELNNTTLAAYRQQTDVAKIGNRTGITLVNPEVEFNYLWGSPTLIGNRTDIIVQQSFDFPTAYALRSKIANLQDENAELLYKAERLNILLLAKKTCIELVYYNALAREYTVRLKSAELISEAYKTKWDRGETNILEYNKAMLNLTTVLAEQERIVAEQTSLILELKRLNGGKEILFSDHIYPTHTLPLHFEEWYAIAETKNPLLQYVRGEIEIGKQEIKLSRVMGLPKFSAGYMSEKVVGEHFQGITFGVSIPLWENKNRVKQAKAQTQAAVMVFEDNKVQFYNRLLILFQKATALQQNAQRVRLSIQNNNNEQLLKRGLDAGEISLLNYLLEMEYCYDLIIKAWEAERDFEWSLAELEALEL